MFLPMDRNQLPIAPTLPPAPCPLYYSCSLDFSSLGFSVATWLHANSLGREEPGKHRVKAGWEETAKCICVSLSISVYLQSTSVYL